MTPRASRSATAAGLASHIARNLSSLPEGVGDLLSAEVFGEYTRPGEG
jgi:hypothetical protein